jgi:regulator of RNase E activity RraB
MDESKIKELIEAHVARNRELKHMIAEKGIDLAEGRSVDLHFWASNEKAASDLALALEAIGYPTTKTSKSSGSDFWNVESQVEASPLAVTDPFFVERLVRLALDHEAEFDGWGTAI